MKIESRLRRANVIAIAIAVVAILIVTLSPAGERPSMPFSFAFDLGRRGAGDAFLNVLLFLPLGIAVAWNGRRVMVAGLFGLLLATVIESAQTILPGRDPALSDILLNSAGAVAGAVLARRRGQLLNPDAMASRMLTTASLLGAALIVFATAYLLSPLPGSALRAETQLELPHSPGTSAGEIRSLLTVTVASAREAVFIARSGNDLLLRYPSRGSAFGFDQPEYWKRGAFEGKASGASTTMSVSRARSRWGITIGADRATLGPTAGHGWAALAYPDEIGRQWGSIVDSLWLFGIFLPIGFWSRGRLRFVAAIAGVLLLTLLPAITGLVATTLLEWAGTATGFFVGAMLEFSARSHPRRP